LFADLKAQARLIAILLKKLTNFIAPRKIGQMWETGVNYWT